MLHKQHLYARLGCGAAAPPRRRRRREALAQHTAAREGRLERQRQQRVQPCKKGRPGPSKMFIERSIAGGSADICVTPRGWCHRPTLPSYEP